MGLWLALLLATQLLQAASWRREASSHGRHQGGAFRAAFRRAAAASRDDDDHATCSCDCCSVVERRPDEVVAGANVKCAPASGHSDDACSEQCAPAEDDKVLRSAAEDQILDYQRFCFFECKPAAGTASFAGSGCVVLEPEEVRRVVDVSGNALDPATVYGQQQLAQGGAGPREQQPSLPQSAVLLPPAYAGAPQVWVEAPRVAAQTGQPAALLGKRGMLKRRLIQSRGQGKQEPEESEDQEQKVEEEASSGNSEDWVARATVQAQRARSAASAVREGLPPPLQDVGSQGSVSDPLAVIADIRSAASQSHNAAERAAESAKTAVQALKEADGVNERTATDAAEAAIEAAQQEEQGTDVESSWQYRAARAAEKASKPFMDVIKYALYVAWQYKTRSEEDERRAGSLETKANALASEAELLRRGGKNAEAQARDEEAEETREEASRLIEEAQNFSAQAAKATENVTEYYSGAKKAAAWAGATLPLPPEQQS